MTAGSDFHDIRWNTRGVGMDVDEADIKPFLDLVSNQYTYIRRRSMTRRLRSSRSSANPFA